MNSSYLSGFEKLYTDARCRVNWMIAGKMGVQED